ncbi:pre-mRNA-splicing regulator WTAP [Petromyzon marinus]|uniref:Pre-mRNA-splicing regulator WTAP n=1 Tax=Petromyzon marinus TaxID=7757 RepID=A0AAJ7XFS2_PETMA|nr:pre-mRNA-splicing regulator WTAP [Petromyzon marinus]XP_061430858.1 pre-mRNA-splicing regulator WTAP-like [Lethenteron reissneri]XP_061430859.1 pre-mRNA-splicing regulator WTAP-like [Lethenteron reissneri]
MADGEPPAKRVRLSDDELRAMSREDLFVRWKQQEGYLRTLESKLADLNSSDVTGLRESEERLKHQQQESLRRENILVMRLATKEQEMQECATQIASLKQGQLSSASHLRSCLVDPAVNLLFTKMKSELQQSKDKLQQAHDELSAWKFTPDR